MTVTDRSTVSPVGELESLLSSTLTMPPVILEERPAERPGAATCSQRLPRDVLVRLIALSRQVGSIRQGAAGNAEQSLLLGKVAAGLDAVIQSIYDETALHLAGRRG